MNKAVIYVRVSSKEQEREGFSIPAQKKFLTDYAVKKGLTVVKLFEEAESAKTSGRNQFKLMLQYLREHKDTHHILVEKTDRLSRNLKDIALLDWSDWPWLNIHLVKENEVISGKSRASQKLMYGMKVLMAQNYSFNLSEEVVKGMDEKAAQGLFPSCAPIGYVNNRANRTIEPDPKRAPLIKRAFELSATGQYSLSKLKSILNKEGLKSARANSELSKSQMQRILLNPIYHGAFLWKGQYFQGKHQPIISKQLFDKVQQQMGFVKRSKSVKYSFAFTNTMTCGHCGCSITAEEKRKKSGKTYTYYHCTSGKGQCEGVTYIREEKINDWISEALTQVQIPEHIIEWTRQALMENHEKEHEYHQKQISILETRYRTLQNKIGKAYEDKLEGTIEHDFWVEQNSRWKQEQADIETQLGNLRTSNTSYIDQGLKLMELARQASTLFKHMSPDEKRELTNLVLSNPTITNGSLGYDLKKPFSYFQNVTDLEKWRSERDSNPRPSA